MAPRPDKKTPPRRKAATKSPTERAPEAGNATPAAAPRPGAGASPRKAGGATTPKAANTAKRSAPAAPPPVAPPPPAASANEGSGTRSHEPHLLHAHIAPRRVAHRGESTPPPAAKPAPSAAPASSGSPKRSSTPRRLVFGLAFAVGFAGATYWMPAAPIIPLAALFFILTGTFEFSRLVEIEHRGVVFGGTIAMGMGFVLWLAAWFATGWLPWALAVTMILAHVLNLFYGRTSQYTSRIALAAFGVVYVALPLALLLQLYSEYAQFAQNATLPVSVIFYLLLMVWAGDTGAYFVGKGLGKHKLAPRLSPNKTVEGLFGGIAATIVAAVVLRELLPHIALVFPTVMSAVMTGVFIGVIAPVGDLAESAIKREAGVKDSGAFLPGHGGILDKIDSLLFAAPVYVAICYLIGSPASIAVKPVLP